MTLSTWTLALAAFLSGAAAAVFTMLVIGIRKGDRAHHLADEPITHVDALTRSVLGVGVRTCRPPAIAAPKENDQCILLISVITACQQSRTITFRAGQAVSRKVRR